MNIKLNEFSGGLKSDILVRARLIEQERQNMNEDANEIDWGSDNETAENQPPSGHREESTARLLDIKLRGSAVSDSKPVSS